MTAAITTAETFLIAMGIIFTVPYLIWRVLRTDYFAPLVVAQIVAGILLGPWILGRVFPASCAIPAGSGRMHRAGSALEPRIWRTAKPKLLAGARAQATRRATGRHPLKSGPGLLA
jgi:hypothetical protein